MKRLTPETRFQIYFENVHINFGNRCSVREIYHLFYNRHNRPTEQVIRITMDHFRTMYTLIDNMHPQTRRTVRAK